MFLCCIQVYDLIGLSSISTSPETTTLVIIPVLQHNLSVENYFPSRANIYIWLILQYFVNMFYQGVNIWPVDN